jgi:hypothetical protein
LSRFFYISIFLLVAKSASAQQSDTVKIASSLSDTLRSSLNSVNTLSEKNRKKIERINARLERQSRNLKATKIKILTSAQDRAKEVLNKPEEEQRELWSKSKFLEKKVTSETDSLDRKAQIDNYNLKVAVLRKHFNHHLDSLKKLPRKDAHTKSVDSLKKKIKHLKNAKSIEDVKKGEQKLAQLQSGIGTKVKGFSANVNKELSSINKLNSSNLSVPKIDIPNVNLPNVGSPKLDANLPINSTLNTSLPDVATEIQGPNLSLPAQLGSPKLQSNSVGNIIPKDGLSEVQKETSQLTDAAGELSKAEDELKNLKPDDLEKTLEKEAKNAKEITLLNGEIVKADQYQKMVEKWESDPEFMKEKAVNQTKDQLTNHFVGHEKELLAGVQQLSDLKKKYKGYEGVLDLFKKPGNAMKGKPFVERLRPGFNIQFQAKHEMMMDFNPQIAYRLTGKISIGIGWNERWGYDFDKWNYVSQDHIFGPRGYAHLKVRESVFLMVAPEVMNTLVPPFLHSTDPVIRNWVWSWMVGMKKEFRFSKTALGSTQILYNLLDNNHSQSPYTSKLNIRIGVEFPLKKKR